MVQAADLGERNDLSRAGWLDRAFVRAILVEGKVSPRSMVIVHIGCEDAAQMTLVEDDNVIEAFASDRADDALSIRILPRRTRCGDDFVDPHSFDALAES